MPASFKMVPLPSVVMPDIKEKLVREGVAPLVCTPEQFAALMKADWAKYGKVVKDAKIKLDL